MSYSVDIELDSLPCKSRAAAYEAAALLRTDSWARSRMKISPACSSSPERDDSWHLVLDDYDPCYWNEAEFNRLWLALVPFMADNAFLEFRHEDASRFRIRWEAGHVFEERPKQVVWAFEREITPEPLKE